MQLGVCPQRNLRFHLSTWVATVTLLSVIGSGAVQAAEGRDGSNTPQLSWQQTETSIALHNRGRVVWEHVHDKTLGKPYMRIGLLDGRELTRPCPIPVGYPKDDHPWHRGLWWSWKFINGANFWEENHQGSEPMRIEISPSETGEAKIHLTLAYHLPGQAPILMEERHIHISPPDARGSYFIDWQAKFTATGQGHVTLNKYRYSGLSIRMAAEFCGDGDAPAWQYLADTEEVTTNGTSVPTRWMAYQGSLSEGRSASVAIFDHPSNRDFPSTWLVRDNYPYMNPTFPCKQDVTLQPGENLTLRYGILVHEGPLTPKKIARRWQRFSREKIKNADAVRFDPVEQNIEGWTVHVDPQMLEGRHAEAGSRALGMLANHLQRIAILMPEEKLAQLRDLEIWIEHHHPTLGAMQYHPSVDWLRSHGHDPRLARKVHIPRAANLLSRQQMLKHPAVVLHELAHAYHDQILSFDNPRIIAVYEEAKAAGIYEQSLLYNGETVRHYGLSNHKEYFAEGTEAYFYRNDFYPFCRAELKEHDPALCDLLEETWGPVD